MNLSAYHVCTKRLDRWSYHPVVLVLSLPLHAPLLPVGRGASCGVSTAVSDPVSFQNDELFGTEKDGCAVTLQNRGAPVPRARAREVYMFSRGSCRRHLFDILLAYTVESTC